MPRTKKTTPRVSREKGQRSIDVPEALIRILPPWQNPRKFLEANIWRAIVAQQPVAVICRENLIAAYLSLDWKIEPKDSEKRDELEEEINYYTELFEYTGKYYYDEIVEWIGKDMLDTPFGGAAEVGRERDAPDGKVLWIEPLDAGTLFPFPNVKTPVGQYVMESGMVPIYFPAHAINRIYYSPQTYIRLEGWGMSPPEKIYLALELLNRGDQYYANLLLDTPEAGILDLGDMEKGAAEEWVKAFRTMLGGIDPMKIPVLYEHNTKVDFIPFGKPPTELMFDKVTAKYASIVAAGYGLTLSDIGIQTTTSGGDTLAGSIRDERKTRRTGFARFKRKLIAFWNFMLPSDRLHYKIIDQDDELSVAISRARLANATAASQYIDKRIFSPGEMRRQAIADGLITISIPENVPDDSEFPEPEQGTSNERTNLIGKPVSPSQGGHGEVLPRGDVFSDEVNRMVNVGDVHLKKLIRSVLQPLQIETNDSLEKLSDAELQAWGDWYNDALWGDLNEKLPELTISTLGNARKRLNELMVNNDWWTLDVFSGDVYEEFSDLVPYELSDIFEGKIIGILENVDKSIPEGIQNCIIAGTKTALINKEFNAKHLDDDTIMSDNRIVEYVRQELLQLGSNIISKFAVQLSDTINKILGDVKNGNETED